MYDDLKNSKSKCLDIHSLITNKGRDVYFACFYKKYVPLLSGNNESLIKVVIYT